MTNPVLSSSLPETYRGFEIHATVAAGLFAREAVPFKDWLRRRAGSVVTFLGAWHHRSRTRAQLATLNERMLSDIGVSRCDIWAEIDKPFWRA